MLSQRVSRDFEAAFRHALMSRLDLIEDLWIKKQEKFWVSVKRRLAVGVRVGVSFFFFILFFAIYLETDSF